MFGDFFRPLDNISRTERRTNLGTRVCSNCTLKAHGGDNRSTVLMAITQVMLIMLIYHKRVKTRQWITTNPLRVQKWRTTQNKCNNGSRTRHVYANNIQINDTIALHAKMLDINK
eukprot:198148-Amphidinium_carterae.2